jgi:hypothetical protein
MADRAIGPKYFKMPGHALLRQPVRLLLPQPGSHCRIGQFALAAGAA